MLKQAAKFAERAHRGMVRKGSMIPYITHPLEAAVIVAGMTDDEELIAAALLHDTMEDAGVTWQDLEKRFGRRVADLVAAETEDKTRTWLERKAETLKHMESADRDLKILVLGDKLSNLRNTARDYLLMGDRVWQRFRVKEKMMHGWYYTGMIPHFEELSDFPACMEYKTLCRMVYGKNIISLEEAQRGVQI